MGRVVTNKYKINDSVSQDDFYSGITINDSTDKKKIAMGRIILTVGQGGESIWVLNDGDIPVKVSQASDINRILELSGTIESFSASVLLNYATSADTYNAISDIKNHITDIYNDIEDLNNKISGATIIANEAINGLYVGEVDEAMSEQSGIKAKYSNGGNAVIDFSDMIIDCGEY